ncbi:MAG: hypothetical protein V4581_14135, partial [Bacteroidota bacterium]
MKKIIMFALFFAALMGCQDDDETVITTEPVAVAFTAVHKGDISGEPLVAANYVINTPAAWNNFKNVANSAY